jgi:hypothetical protein
LLDVLRNDEVAAIIKFGMGLLRIPSSEQLSVPILSYHHGDPAEFRGRPAGFYEMLAGRSVMGQVVQRLSNDLDAGDIVASARVEDMGALVPLDPAGGIPSFAVDPEAGH